MSGGKGAAYLASNEQWRGTGKDMRVEKELRFFEEIEMGEKM